MKAAIIALSTLIALPAIAMAEPVQTADSSTTVCVTVDPSTGKKVTVDCAATGSIDMQDKASGPRLGIDVNPWIPGI